VAPERVLGLGLGLGAIWCEGGGVVVREAGWGVGNGGREWQQRNAYKQVCLRAAHAGTRKNKKDCL